MLADLWVTPWSAFAEVAKFLDLLGESSPGRDQ